MDKLCQFCDVESFKHQIILKNNDFNVIYSRSPLVKGHVMIIVKRHIRSFSDLTEKEILSFFSVLKKTSNLLKKVYYFDGINLFTNIGEKAGQSVPHLHFHLIPRYSHEKESPFRKLNNSKYSNRRLTKEEIVTEVKQLKSCLNRKKA